MHDEDLVDTEIRHEDPDDILSVGARDSKKHQLTVEANRLRAGQSDTELRSLAGVDQEQRLEELGSEIQSVNDQLSRLGEKISDAESSADRMELLDKREQLRSKREEIESERDEISTRQK